MRDFQQWQSWIIGGIGIAVGVLLFIITFVYGAIECARAIAAKNPEAKRKHFVNLGLNIVFFAIGITIGTTIPIFRETILSWMSYIGR